MKNSNSGCSFLVALIIIGFIIGLVMKIVEVVTDAINTVGPYVAVLLVWWSAVTITRLGWSIFGRLFGFYNPAHFHIFTKLWLWWRPIYRYVWLPVSWWIEEVFRMGKFSTGRFAGSLETMSHVYKPGYIYLGRLRLLGIPVIQPVGIDGRGGKHLCMMAGTGSGKTTHLISMLGLHDGTAFIIDPKGQIASVIARRFSEGGNGVIGKNMKVVIFDPSGLVTEHRSLLGKWNPFVEIQSAANRAVERGVDPAHAVVDFAQKIANGLITQTPKQDPFWTGASRDFLHGLILHVYTTEPPERQNLGRLYQLLTVGLPEESQSNNSGFDMLLWAMSQNHHYGGVISQSIAGLVDAGQQTAGSVLITLREQLQWLKLPALQQVSEDSSFCLEELHKGKLVLFVCAKFSDISTTFPGWFRLLSVLALAVFEDINRPLKRPCLFVLDEFPSLGKIDAVEVAAPTMRSYGVRLLVISQNIGQLRPLYENWETFIGNSECTWWMGTKHSDNLSYLETKLGKVTIKSKRYGIREREVMTADQIEHFLNQGNVIVTRGGRPFRLRPEFYFKALPVCFYDTDRNYRETVFRAFTRQLFAKFLHNNIVRPPVIPENFARVPNERPVLLEEFTISNHRPLLTGNFEETDFVDVEEMDEPEGSDLAVVTVEPAILKSNSWPAADPEFVRLFIECFGEEGRYPAKRLRRAVYDGFTKNLERGGDFQTLHIGFEDWLTLAESKLEKSESDRVGGFFDNAVTRSQGRH